MTDSRDKQVIKNIQAKAQIISKLQDKASKVLVLSMGSYTFKMGFANQKVPFIIKPFVAYRKIQNKQGGSKQMQLEQQYQKQDIDTAFFKKQYVEIETHLKNQGIISLQHRPVKGKPRGKQNIPLNPYPDVYPVKDILCSQEALIVEDCPNQYIFRKPIKYGQFNIKNNSPEQLQNCLNDIQHLLRYMLKQKLKIPQKQWKTFSCIIAVPDVFIRSHFKHLISMIFTKICFNKLYIHLQSVLACLGTAISSAVVVDIGHQKINICCVDEGVILPKTLVRKNFGLKNITKTMIKLFNSKINEQGYDLLINSETDIGQVDQIKQLACVVKQPQEHNNKVYQIKTFRNKKQIQISINYSDVMCIAANSIFFNIWNSFQIPEIYFDAFNPYSQLYDLQSDPQDLFEEFSGGGHIFEIQESGNYSKQTTNPYIYQPLEQLVAASITSIKDPQARKKFLSNILLIGGGGLVPQLSEQLIVRINKIFQTGGQSQDKAESATDLFIKQIDLSHSSWLGGTVLPKLDSLRDLWIERSKYIGCMKQQSNQIEQQGALDKKLFTRKQESQQWGIRYLKQKIPFLW